MSYRYEAQISTELQDHSYADIIEIPAIADAKDGFWIDTAGKFTRNIDDEVMWIPPAQILYVKRIKSDKA